MSSKTIHKVYPFLTLRATKEYEYRATQPSDLRLFLEAVRADSTLLPMIKQTHLREEFDNMADSGVLEFAAAACEPATDNSKDETEEEYENEDDEVPIASTSHDPFEAAAENLRLVNDPIDGLPTEDMYQKLLEELLVVFSENEVISCSMGWNVSQQRNI
ncbi:hypothetical protein HBI49_026600 [Parastagonospora nodorum]|nr:hypothetical protein HBI06_183290 [Parastagonospora nodorum]KAH4241027.1 hypothetical protein HBI05_103920 [Parastagonospora nodorum]KAH5378691.1 hypothetical protein HBI49_026600 [Parastagonospora nodorum]KAH5544751.1 hypothetical protein HBI27_059570 [Parastagonospora nodorum]KAH5656851.1 hypothetical protein HBI51_030560 [Parastagonospora nodorum]